jgi:hypothetical protein
LPTLQAADTETRQFSIQIDGKKAGTMQMSIDAAGEGNATVQLNADVKLNYLIYSYTYSLRCTETWKNGQLIRLGSTANDNGKNLRLTVAAERDTLLVRASGPERRVRRDAWPTTFWHLPDPAARERPLTLLDADTGAEMHGRLQRIDIATLRVGAASVECTHYRLVGNMTVDLWYDASDRLVRKEGLEDGHKTILELTQVKR